MVHQMHPNIFLILEFDYMFLSCGLKLSLK